MIRCAFRAVSAALGVVCLTIGLASSGIVPVALAQEQPPTEGLRLWLKADAGVTHDSDQAVTEWVDQSSNGRVLTIPASKQPTWVDAQLNGKPVVRFDGIGNVIELPDIMAGATAGEIVAVARVVPRPDTLNTLWQFGSGYGSGYYNNDHYQDFGTNEVNFHPGSPDYSSFHIAQESVTSSGVLEERVNGILRWGRDGATVAFNSTPTIGLFQGDIAEVLVYDHPLTEADRDSIGRYLTAKYALPNVIIPPKPVLYASAAGSDLVDLSWTGYDASSHTVTILERSEGGGDFVEIGRFEDQSTGIDTGVGPSATYQYRIKLKTYAGESEYSEAVTVTTLPEESQRPPTGMRLWLRASLHTQGPGPLSAWGDDSGNGGTAMQFNADQKPVVVMDQLNGYPVVRFDGVDDLLDLPDVMHAATAGEIFIVMKVADFTNELNGICHFGTGTGNVDANGYGWNDFGTGSIEAFHDLPTSVATSYHVYNASVDNAGTSRLRFNGFERSKREGETVSFRLDPCLGGTRNGEHLKGDVAEVIVYDHVLSDAERETVASYLTQKYTLPMPRPAYPVMRAAVAGATQIDLSWSGRDPGVHTIATLERKVGEGEFVVLRELEDVSGYVDKEVDPSTTYTYRVKLRTFGGSTDYSPIVMATTLPVELDVPKTGIRLWLRASAGTQGPGPLSVWADQSGSGHDVFRAESDLQPQVVEDQLNGMPVVRFDGIDDLLRAPNVMQGATAGEIIAVVKVDPRADTFNTLWEFGSGYGSGYYNSDRYEDFGTNEVNFHPGYPRFSEYHYSDVAIGNGVLIERANGLVVWQKNGAVVTFNQDSTIGGFKGDVAELIVYDHVLAEDERERLAIYLTGKYQPSTIGVLGKPTLSAFASSATDVDLVWTGISSSTRTVAVIERKQAGGDFETVAVPADVSTFTDEGLTASTTYTYRVRLETYAGDSEYSDPVTVTTLSSQLLVPSQGLRAWLKASSGTQGVGRLTHWVDQSGLGHDAYQTNVDLQPVVVPNQIKGRPVVRFDGVDDVLDLNELTMAGAGAGEIIAVVKAADFSTGFNGLWQFGTGSGTIYTDGAGWNDFGTTSEDPYVGPPTYILTQPHVVDASINASGVSVLGFNGAEHLRKTGQSVSFRADPCIGATRSGYYLKGDVAEVLVYDHELSTADRASILSYLQVKYGVPPPFAAPTGLSGSANLAGRITLTWAAGAAGTYTYEVQRKSPSDADFVTVATGLTSPTYIDTTAASGVQYAYRVRAVNDTGVSIYTGAFVITNTNTEMPNQGLTLWLRADQGLTVATVNGVARVSLWKDQSGLGNDAKALSSTPAYMPSYQPSGLNGMPAIFAAYGFTLPQLPIHTTGGEYFVVLNRVSSVGTDDLLSFSAYRGIRFVRGSVVEYFLSRDKRAFSSTSGIQGGHIYNISAGPGQWVARIDSLTRYEAFDNVTSFSPSRGALGVGWDIAYGDGYDNLFNGSIAEVILYDRRLTDAERSQVEAYLNQRYNIIKSPSVPTGLKLSQPAIGSSVTLEWDPLVGPEVTFEVQRKLESDADFVTIASNLRVMRYRDAAVPLGACSYRVRAINGYGQQSPYSAPVTLTVGSSSAPFPDSGLALWLRSDLGVNTTVNAGTTFVTAWADQSGNGRDALPPVLNYNGFPKLVATGPQGRPAVSFSSYIELALPPILSASGQQGEYFVVEKNAPSISFYSNHSSGGYGGIFDNFLSTSSKSIPSSVVLSSYHLYNAIAQPGQWEARVDGVTRLTTANTVPASIGSSGGTMGGTNSGDIAEVLVYDHALSESDRASVYQYLQNRYNIIKPVTTPTGLIVDSPLLRPQVRVRWVKPTGQELSYNVERQGPNEFSYSTIATGLTSPLYFDNAVAPGAQYYYRVRALNGLGDSATSAPVVITVPTYTTEIPSRGVRVWVRADRGILADGNGYISEWMDQSGSANGASGKYFTATDNAKVIPNAINGQPVVRITGFGELNFGYVLSNASGGEVFIYHKKTHYTGEGLYKKPLLFASYPDKDGKIKDSLGNASPAIFTPTQSVYNYHLYNIAVGGNRVARIDGIEQFRDNAVWNSYATGYVSFASVSGAIFSGDVAEMIVYDRVLSDDERATVQNYFFNKYNQVTFAPSFTPTPGRFEGSVAVTLSSATTGADIYYTVDGSTPVVGTSPLYTAPINVSQSTTIKAIANKNGVASQVSSGIFSIGVAPGTDNAFSGFAAAYYENADFTGGSVKRIDKVILPSGVFIPAKTRSIRWTGNLTAQYSEIYTFSVNSGGYPKLWIGDTLVIDGSNLSSPQEISGSIRLAAGQTYPIRLEYLVRNTNSPSSEGVTLYWTSMSITKEVVPSRQVNCGLPYSKTVVKPTATPASGRYPDSVTVSLSVTDGSGAKIYYSVDGSEPTAASTLYTTPLTFRQDITLRAVAYATGYNDSGLLVAPYTIDSAGPVLSDLKFNNATIPAVIDADGTFSITATDTAGVNRVQFSLDGQILATDGTAGDGFTAPFLIDNTTDGSHSLTIKAWDNVGVPSDPLIVSLNVQKRPPAPPVISSPGNGEKVNQASVSVRGTAEKNSLVTVYRGADALGSIQAGANGSFSIPITLNPGANDIYATAKNRNPTPGDPCSTVRVIYDNTVPSPAVGLSAESKSAGAIFLTWSPPSGLVSGYYLFRSTTAIPDNASFTLSQAIGGKITATSYTDTPPADGRYYYRVLTTYTVGSNETLSPPSNQADALSDRTPPSATLTLQPLGQLYDAVNNRFGRGIVQAHLVVSEKLATPPFLNLSIAGSQSVFIDLMPAGTNAYDGVFTIGDTTRSGAVSASFSAYDDAGNRGNAVTITPPAIIDTAGPKVIGLTPVTMTSATSFDELPERLSIHNQPTLPETAVTVYWKLTLDEPTKGSVAPTISANLSGHPSAVVPVAVTDAFDSDPRTWLVKVTLPADAGTEVENLTLSLSATDDLENQGTTIDPAHSFQIYKNGLPPLAVPTDLTVQARPAGAIYVSWTLVDRASAYVLQVKGPSQSTFQDLQVLAGNVREYSYTPSVDGLYTYQVASVRHENNEETTSGWSAPASATSDRVPPSTPTGFSVQIVPGGVKGSWTATNDPDVQGFSLYRSNAAITSVQSLTAVLPRITKLANAATDPSPDPSLPYYGLVAFDAAGNRSDVASAFVNVSLLPVRTIAVSRKDADAPALTWSAAPGSVIDGYNLSINGAPVAINGQNLIPTSITTYSDAAYQSGDRTYGVKTVSGPDSRERTILLPEVLLEIPVTANVKRGLVNRIQVVAHNLSSQAITNAKIVVRLAGRDHASADSFDLAAGEERSIPVVVGGYDDLPSQSAPALVTLTSTPNAGETISILRTLRVAVSDGALTAEVIPGEFLRGGSGKLKFKLTNASTENIEFKVARNQGRDASDEVRLVLRTQQGALLSSTPVQLTVGDYLVTLSNGTTVVRIPAGVTYTSPSFSVPVPLTAPATVVASFEMDSVYYNLGEPDTQIQLKGPRAQTEVVARESSYLAEVATVTPAESNGQEPITISGRALLRGVDANLPSARAIGVPVMVSIENNGFIRRDTVVSDAVGNFSFVFQPASGERGGIYHVWASHPDVTAQPDTTLSFTLRTVMISPQTVNYRVPRNYRRDLPVQVTTGPGTTLQNLRAVLVSALPAAVSVTANPIAIVSPNQTVPLPVSVVGTAPTPDSTNTGALDFNIVSDAPNSGEFNWGTVRVNYEFSEAKPSLQATPNLLQLGLQPSQTVSGSITLKNVGFGPLENATAQLVNGQGAPLPAWVRLQTAAALGNLDVGAEATVTVAAAAPSDIISADQVYQGLLRIQGSNTTAQDFPITVTLSPSGVGKALLKIVDPYYQVTLPDGVQNPGFNGVVGASIVLEKESSNGIPTVSVGKVTDGNGEVMFTELPAGRYKLRVSADRHDPYIARITVNPGVVYADTIQLTYSPVSFSWEVVPVTFQDRYEIVLTATYETNVPVPVVVIEPASISVPKMCAGQTYAGELRITNHGLIDAINVQVPQPASDEYFSYQLSPTFGDKIKAGQTVRVPYQIKCLKALPGYCPDAPAAAMTDVNAGALAGTQAFTPRTASAAGSTLMNGGCSAYTACWIVYYDYECVNGQYVARNPSRVCVTGLYGCTSGSASTPDPTTINWGPSWGSSAPDCPACGPIGSGSTTAADTSDDCFPPPNPPPYCDAGGGGGGGGGGGAGDSCEYKRKDKRPEPEHKDCEDRKAHVGSWVDIPTRQLRDSVFDLSLDVPGGSVGVQRDYVHRRWYFRMTDDLYASCYSNAATCGMVVLNGTVYTKPQPGTVVTVIGGMSIIEVPVAKPVSELAEGTYLMGGIGPQKITKKSDGSLVWVDGLGMEKRFNADGRLLARVYRGQIISEYHYDGSGLLTSISDRTGRTVLTCTYDGTRLINVRDFGGREVSYTWDSEGRLETATDVLGTKTTYAYDNWWHLTSKRTHIKDTPADTDHLVTIKYRVYTPAPQPVTPPERVIEGDYIYKERVRGQVTSITHNLGDMKTFVFHWYIGSSWYHVLITNAAGHTQDMTYDGNGVLIRKAVDGVQVYMMGQDSRTRVMGKGSDQRITEEVDDQGNIIRRVLPNGGVERFEYDYASNKLKRAIAADGMVTEYEYDTAGNETKETIASGSPLARVTTSVYYPGTNLLKERTEPGGRRTAYEYDGFDRITRSYDPDTPGLQTSYTYDQYGRVETVTDALGRVTRYAYDAANHITEETNPLGEKTVYTYQGDRLIQVETGRTNAPGRITRYTYNAKGLRLTEKRLDADGNEHLVTTYAYDEDDRVISITNALNETTAYTYDGNGNLIRTSYPDADGGRCEARWAYAYDRLMESIDPTGVRTTYTYDPAGRLLTKVEAAGTAVERTTSNRYDLVGRVLEEKLTSLSEPGKSYTLTHVYDAVGQPTSLGGNRAYPQTMHYNARGQIDSVTDAINRVIAFTYDSQGRVTEIRVNGALTQAVDYDSIGNRIAVRDGFGNHCHFRYDALNRLTHESVPLAPEQAAPTNWWNQKSYVLQAAEYTPWGEVKSVARYTADGSDVREAVTRYTYDAFGRRLTETDAAGLARTFTYDEVDNLLKISYPAVVSSGELVGTSETYLHSPYNSKLVDAAIDRAGNITHYVYDKRFRVIEQTNSLGGISRTSYDPLGRISSIVDPANNTTSYSYTLFDQVSQIIHPDHVAGSHERMETFIYDDHGKLTVKAGAGGYPLVNRYDAVGRLSELQDANGKVTRWSYTVLDQVETKTYADNTQWNYTYDAAGRMKTRRDAMGRLTQYVYNAYGLLTAIDYATDSDVTFDYDQQGRRVRMIDGSGTTTWTYDATGRLASETQGRSHRVVHYQFDAQSLRTGLDVVSTDSGGSSWSTAFAYDNSARLRSVLDNRVPSAAPYSYTYASNANLVAQIATPTGHKIAKTYDTSGRLTSIGATRASGSAINAFSYTYDAASQRTQEAALDRTRDFTYDQYRQLTQSKVTAGGAETLKQDFSFDAIGNRLSYSLTVSGNTQTTSYTANAVNQYTALAGAVTDAPTYDPNGNTLGFRGKLLTYDEENRLVQVVNGVQKVVYVYDGLGRRVERMEYLNGAVTALTHYTYDGWRVLEESDQSYTVLKGYLHGLDLSTTFDGSGGIGGLLAILKPGGSRYAAHSYTYDGNGNVDTLVDDSGTMTAQYVYGPFGETISAAGSLSDFNTYQFSSKDLDQTAELAYYGFRYYSPSTGSWMSRDPLGEVGGMNLHGFVANNPIGYYDPFGLRMDGHHIIPESVWNKIFGSSARSQGIWDAVVDTSEGVIDVVEDGGHNFTAHYEYNRRVQQAIVDYLRRTKQSPNCINQKIARRILRMVKKLDDPYVQGFNRAAADGIAAVKAWKESEGLAIMAGEEEVVRAARAASGLAEEAAFLRYARRGGKIVKVVAVGAFIYTASQEGVEAATEQTLKDLVFYDEIMSAGDSLIARGLDMFYWTSPEKRFRDSGFSDDENPLIDTAFPDDITKANDACCKDTEGDH